MLCVCVNVRLYNVAKRKWNIPINESSKIPRRSAIWKQNFVNLKIVIFIFTIFILYIFHLDIIGVCVSANTHKHL